MCWKIQKNPKIQMFIKCDFRLLCDVVFIKLEIIILTGWIGKEVGDEKLRPIW